MMLRLVALVTVATLCLGQKCDVSPQFWCDTAEIATACGVQKQCNALLSDTPPAKVKVALYYESLCPYCRLFIFRSLSQAVKTVPELFHLTVVYKPAHKPRWQLMCQHGPAECLGNRVEACVLHLEPQKKMGQYSPWDAARSCYHEHPGNVRWKDLVSCANGALGTSLIHQNGKITNALNPPHQYVPWVTINGKHSNNLESKALENLTALVCDLYRGPKPAACKKQLKRTYKF